MEVGYEFVPDEDVAAVAEGVVEVAGKAKHMLGHEYFQDSPAREVEAAQATTRSADNLAVSLGWTEVRGYRRDV